MKHNPQNYLKRPAFREYKPNESDARKMNAFHKVQGQVVLKDDFDVIEEMRILKDTMEEKLDYLQQKGYTYAELN